LDHPAFARPALARLVGLAVLRQDILWRHREHCGAPRAADNRGQCRVLIQRVALIGVTPETVLTRHGSGGTVLGAIPDEEPLGLAASAVGQRRGLLKALADLKKPPLECLGPDRIKPGAHRIITGKLRTATQGAGIMVSRGWLAGALILPKRRRLHKKAAKGP
jgi:hypothetical protein